MAAIDELNLAITQTPAVLAQAEAKDGNVNLANFADKGEIHFCGENKLIVAELKDFRISGDSKLTVILTTNLTYTANFAGNVKTFKIGVNVETAQVEHLDFEFEDESISIGFLGERELVETQ